MLRGEGGGLGEKSKYTLNFCQDAYSGGKTRPLARACKQKQKAL